MNAGLLAHLTGRFVTQAENLATESLGYLLSVYPAASAAFEQSAASLCPGLPTGLRFRTQNWLAEDQAIPDLVGLTADGQQPLVVEAKFWAGLTENQPVTYLHRLPAGAPGLLLFLVPEVRAAFVWDELVRRCTTAGLSVEALPAGPGSARVARVEAHRMAVVSWRTALDALAVALGNEGDRTGLNDLGQLQGLCQRQDEEAFLPLTSQELSGSTGRRMLQFGTLIDDATTRLVSTGKASIKGLTRTAWAGGYGRYLRLGDWETLLHVNFEQWSRSRATPVWLRISDKRAKGHLPLADALAPLRNANPTRLLEDAGLLVVPVFLDAGADRDGALAQVLAQVVEVHELVVKVPAVT